MAKYYRYGMSDGRLVLPKAFNLWLATWTKRKQARCQAKMGLCWGLQLPTCFHDNFSIFFFSPFYLK